jgi:hypothetical protein
MKSNVLPLMVTGFDNESDDTIKARDVAAYTASMLSNLSRLARATELNVLAYLLDMARLEAESNVG